MLRRATLIDSAAQNRFGTHLRLLRRRARLTQAELGRAVGYSDAQISRLEMGRRPPDLSTLVALFFPALAVDPLSEEARTLLTLAGLARAGGAHPEVHSEPTRASPAAPAAGAAGLPVPPTPLLGRLREREELSQLIADGAARMITLLGPAGVGKTHLALQLAHDLHPRLADGAHFVDLAPIDDPTLVPSALARALDLSEEGHADAPAALRAALQRRQALLVLDNFEQVRTAAPLLAELLAAAPGLRLLVTSRVALRLRAEQIFPLPPLAVPDLARLPPLDELARVESLALLLARLRAGVPDLALTRSNALPLAAICVRVEGLPLAIELVAARGRLLGPQELLAEVTQHFMQLRRRGQDVPPRHQTLAAALAWSYEQLPSTTRALFARLSIFPGSWGADAAAAVCDLEGWGRAALFDALDVLLDHSLLHRQAEGELARLSLLAMVREFAQARLAERTEGEQLQRRLLAYCLDLAEQAGKEMLYGPSLGIWTTRLDAEHDVLRAALAYAFEASDHERGLRLASALRMFWYTRGYLREGRRWLERFLDLAAGAPRPIEPRLRAAALDDAAVLAWRQGDYHEAERLGTDAAAIYRHIADNDGEARALMHLGLIAFDRGDTATSRARFEASLTLYRAIDNPLKTVGVLHNLANLHNQLNESERALPLYAECLAIYEQTDDSSGIALVSLGMGAIYRDQADLPQAVAAFNRSRALASELGDDWSAAVALLNLGDIAADTGDYPAARLQLGAALAQFEQIGDQQMISTAHGRLGDVELLAGDIAAAVGRFRQCLMLASAIEYQHGIAGGLEGLAGCAAREQPELSARLLGCAAGIRAATGVPIPLADQPRYDRLLQLAQSHLRPAAWALAWDEGARLPAARAVAMALSTIAPR